MVFIYLCYQSHQSGPEDDNSPAVSESDELEQGVNSENNSVAQTDGSEEGSVGEVLDDSDADGDWKPKVGSGGEEEGDEEDEEEYEASDDGLSGTELTKIERVKKDFPESEPSSPVENISGEVLDPDKTMDYVDSEERSTFARLLDTDMFPVQGSNTMWEIPPMFIHLGDIFPVFTGLWGLKNILIRAIVKNHFYIHILA